MMTEDPEMLIGLSEAELEALAEGTLAPAAQAKLDGWLAQNAQNKLSVTEKAELDRLLERIDQLTLLKTRARYTLDRQRAGATRA
jgi:hypothetical protein